MDDRLEALLRHLDLTTRPESQEEFDAAMLRGELRTLERRAKLRANATAYEALTREETAKALRELEQLGATAANSCTFIGTPPSEPTPLPTLPARFASYRLGDPWFAQNLTGKILESAAALTRSLRKAVFLGESRKGKTSLACAMLRATVEANPRLAHRCRFIAARDLGVARAQHKLGDGEAPLVTEAVRATVLVLDDLGKETTGAQSAVPFVIEARHDANLPTWVTTGLTFTQIQERYDGGNARRLFDPSEVVILQCGTAAQARPRLVAGGA